MINKEKVRHIAKLARLGLTDKEIDKFQKDLSSILGYIDKLKEVDISEIESTSHSVSVENVARKDVENPELKEQSSKLLDLAPDKKDGYLKVKSVL